VVTPVAAEGVGEVMITPENSHCEHINDTESHDEDDCPGHGQCAVYDGLRRLLDQLDRGEVHFVRVQ